MAIALDPVVLGTILLACAAYARAIRVLARRGIDISRWQQAAYYTGVMLMGLALMGPSGAYADELLLAHMAEHLIIADVAAPLLLVGIRSPVLLFLLPKPALKALARRRVLRAVFRTLRRAPVAAAVYLVVLYAWHLRALFEGALESDLLHVLQHQSFVGISLLVWWSALEPDRRHMPGDLWKIGHITGVRLISIFLGMAMLFSKSAWYEGYYGESARKYGLSPLADQQFAGGMMMTLDVVIVFFALCLFFWRAAADHDRAEAAAGRKA